MLLILECSENKTFTSVVTELEQLLSKEGFKCQLLPPVSTSPSSTSLLIQAAVRQMEWVKWFNNANQISRQRQTVCIVRQGIVELFLELLNELPAKTACKWMSSLVDMIDLPKHLVYMTASSSSASSLASRTCLEEHMALIQTWLLEHAGTKCLFIDASIKTAALDDGVYIDDAPSAADDLLVTPFERYQSDIKWLQKCHQQYAKTILKKMQGDLTKESREAKKSTLCHSQCTCRCNNLLTKQCTNRNRSLYAQCCWKCEKCGTLATEGHYCQCKSNESFCPCFASGCHGIGQFPFCRCGRGAPGVQEEGDEEDMEEEI